MKDRIATYVSLGRFMLDTSKNFADNDLFNKWVRVGEKLVEIGLPFTTDPLDYSAEDRSIVHSAALVMSGKNPMPELLTDTNGVKKNHRKPRMSKAISKVIKAASTPVAVGKRPRGRPRKHPIKISVVSNVPKKRGRPPKNKHMSV